MSSSRSSHHTIERLARAGLIAKGAVYCLLGLLVFMAAFRLGGASPSDTDKQGVLQFVQDQTGGQILLGAIAIGLLCYTLWRFAQAFLDSDHKGKGKKGIATRLRYAFSGVVYASVAVQAGSMLLGGGANGGDNQQNLAQELLSKPYGQWLAGLAAIVLLGVGGYQIYYGLSEKYKKHVQSLGRSAGRLLTAGKIGYVARGLVWLVLGWLFGKAALESDASQAGDTSKAFSFLQGASYGPVVLGAIGLGLICYGVFSFIRARYERMPG